MLETIVAFFDHELVLLVCILYSFHFCVKILGSWLETFFVIELSDEEDK